MKMNKENTYTSTGSKYARNFEMIKSLRNGIGHPNSLQISLTNKCNLNCVFCSVSKRDKSIEWNYGELVNALSKFENIGVKTVELTGSGEPTLYEKFIPLVWVIKRLGLKIGMITNGIKLKDIPEPVLNQFDWIRVSLTSLDYVEDIEIPSFKGTLGFSYIVGQKVDCKDNRKYYQSDSDSIKKIKKYVDKYNPAYVRVVPECFSNLNEMKSLYAYWDYEIKKIGYPFFFQHKKQRQASYCYMDAVKPWLGTDGYVYPCNSISLNSNADRDFISQYRLCHWTEVDKYYKHRGNKTLDVKFCDRCTFTTNNREILDLLTPVEHEDFV